ncbi:helix-turn-helix domain-containing protein [Methylomonas sp. CM2]|uniref:helix-turn-helix domain-containing protein n=1 Tax=Methylomonas sp. CM2 TaxID=3417647 RepID=UPI003CF8F29D
MKDSETLANNLRRLMDHYEYTQTDVAIRAKVSQKQVSDILTQNAKLGASIGQIGAIANDCFKIATWHLLMPNCPDELLFNHSLEKLVENYIHNDAKGRNATLSVSEIRAQYFEEQKTGRINGE